MTQKSLLHLLYTCFLSASYKIFIF